jgi:hypothetical protein
LISAPFFRHLATIGVLCGLASSGCGVIDRLTGSGTETFSIQQFTLDQKSVASGTPVVLSWNVQGADAVEIDNGIGKVPARGSKTLRPELTATYTLTARSGSSTASASVLLTIKGSGTDPGFLLPTPTPSPSPSPSPTPKAPTPGASPSPSPSPGSSDRVVSCGVPARATQGCALRITPGALGPGECLELTGAVFDRPCPADFATVRRLSFSVNANTRAAGELTWRRARASSDVLTPSSGRLPARGQTTVEVEDLALSQAVVIEVADGERVLLTFSLAHN